ncbi:MAG: hypothetical protein ACFFKA_18790 [Candidatus Thorarchaeota archaeon]
MRKNFAYCNHCEKEILKPKRRAMDSMYYNIWILTIISSLGIALIPFLIYRYVILKRKICPTCHHKLEFYKSKEDFPEPKAQIARILQTIEQEKTEKEKSIICPYCREEIKNYETTCPSCGSTIKE